MPSTMENLNLKARRRNVKEAPASTRDNSELSSVETETNAQDNVGGIPNGGIPRISSLVNFNTSTKEKSEDILDRENHFFHDRLRDAETPEQSERRKTIDIRKSPEKDPSLLDSRLPGCADRGLVDDDTRRKLWPRLLRLNDDEQLENDEKLDAASIDVPDEVYQQILKDVARSGGHLGVTATDGELEHFHNQLTQLICWVLHRHPRLNYYQGYNDIAATILLVMGLQRSLRILERISLNFLERFMERTMETVNQELFYIFALLHRVHPTLLVHLENVELFPHFALAEYTTWYAHKYAENRKLLHRLFDFFLASPPLMPLYLSTVIVAHRDAEIFNTTPDMGHTHKVLCTLPDDLPFEKLLVDAKNLYSEYPPDSIINDVREFDKKRRSKEQEWKSKAEASRRERERLRQLKVAAPSRTIIPYPRFRSYRTITVVTILAIGIYAFLKTGTGLN